MIKNYITVCMLSVFCAFSISQLSAQEQKEVHKVVVVEKVKDENGNVTEKKIVKEGKEAEEYIKSMEGGSWTTAEGTEIDLEGKDVKFVAKKACKIVTIDEDGNEKVIEWDGEGEMPAEMKAAMAENDIDIDFEKEMKVVVDYDVESDGEGHKTIKIVTDDNGDEDEMIIVLEGDDIPDEVLQQLKEKNIHIDIMDEGENEFVFEVEKDKNSNKAQLGVFIENDDNGTKVTEIMEGSAAEKAGLQAGDIIKRVNDTPVSSIETLLESLSGFAPGDIAIIEYTREGTKASAEVVLQERKDPFEHKKWKEVIMIKEYDEDHEGDHEEEEEKVIKKKIKIKKDNK